MNEKEKIKRVLNVFHDYLQDSPVVEILFSEKKQCYYYMRHYSNDMDDLIRVEDAETLCDLLLREIDMDVYLELKLDQRTGQCDVTPEAKKVALERMQPYLKQLPEYADLINEIYEN